MSWARLDDAILDNPKIIAAGPLGFALHVAAITWCARNLTDGRIPKVRAHMLFPGEWEGEALGLCALKLWKDTGDCYELHDFLEYNLSKKRVLNRRLLTAARMKRHRDAVTDARVTDLPGPVPVPVRELSLASQAQGEPESGFAQFWLAYPKKRHKPQALKAWRRVAREAAAISAGLERWALSEQWLSGRIEDPATFLNQRQWEDPVPAAAADADAVRRERDRARVKAQLFGEDT